jgi:hypothetical protein
VRYGKFKGQENVGPQVVQTNNVASDDRGYVYIVDRANTGMHVLELQGKAREIIGK